MCSLPYAGAGLRLCGEENLLNNINAFQGRGGVALLTSSPECVCGSLVRRMNPVACAKVVVAVRAKATHLVRRWLITAYCNKNDTHTPPSRT